MPSWLWLFLIVPVAVTILAGVLIALRPRRVPAALALSVFDRHRAELQAQFFDAAVRSGKPRGLRWLRCDWGEALALARDRQSNQLLALVGVTIAFEAITGSDMEGLAAVGNLRTASAVFVFDGRRWTTAGRAVFNLSPEEAIQHFGAQYERV